MKRDGVIAVALLLISCAPPRVGMAPTVSNSASEQRYQEVLAKYSAHGEAFAQLDTHAFFGATYQSRDFVEARVERQGEFQSSPASVVEAELAKEESDRALGPEFFVGIFVTDYHFDDLDRRDTAWRIELVTSSGEVTPASVKRVGRATYNLRGYYPYLGDFWTAYRVRFPAASLSGAPVLGPDDREVVLRFSSTFGRVEMKMPTQ